MVRESLSPSTSVLSRHTIALLERLFPPPRSFALRLWDGTWLPVPTGASFTLVLNHPGALRRMFTPPIELSLGEAFISGDFEVEAISSPPLRSLTTSQRGASR